jgi:dTMP kinase
MKRARNKSGKAKSSRDGANGAGAATPTAAAEIAAAKAKADAIAEAGAMDVPLLGVKGSELGGTLIVVEGTDGSGRSTHISLLVEWLESEGFAVQTMGLRRSNLVGRDIDELLAANAVTRLTLALMYATDFFDQLEHRIIPALRSGLIVLADRYIYTLIARAAVRGIARDYLDRLYSLALKPDLTFWLNVEPEVAFEREFKKTGAISYWEAGRDMSLSNNLHRSFIRYQTMVRREFAYLAKKHGFVEINGHASVPAVNHTLRKAIAEHLRIKRTKYRPSPGLLHLWR